VQAVAGNYLTTKDAAKQLGVSKWRVCALIRAGRLKAQRFGWAWQILLEDLEAVRVRRPGRPPRQRNDRLENDKASNHSVVSVADDSQR
jgi:excisionase family DNA binding protein